MKPEKIYFGQIAFKFEVSKGLVDRINAKCETLDDKTIGFLDGWGFRNADGKMSMYPLMRELKNVLIKKYKNINILWVLKDNEHFPAKEDEIKKILNADVIVNGEAI